MRGSTVMDNLSFGPDAQINHTIGLLRATGSGGALTDGSAPVPGVFFVIDPEGKVEGSYTTGGDSLVQLSYTIATPPRWLALHLSLGAADLGKAAVFGVVCKSRATEAATFRLCLRSATAAGFVDTFLHKHVVAFSESSVHVDLLKLEGRDDVPPQAAWRELILFFQTIPADFDILDLRVFIV